jgi:hypothetical protein
VRLLCNQGKRKVGVGSFSSSIKHYQKLFKTHRTDVRYSRLRISALAGRRSADGSTCRLRYLGRPASGAHSLMISSALTINLPDNEQFSGQSLKRWTVDFNGH